MPHYRIPVWLRAGVLTVAAAGWLGVPALQAQLRPEVQLVLAALPSVREALPPGPAALDPQLLCTPRLAGWTCPKDVDTAAGGLGLMLHSRNFVHVCPGDRRSCRLVSARSLVLFSEPAIRGATATMMLDVWWQSDDRTRPVSHRRARLTFQRIGTTWQLDRTEPVVATTQ